MRFAFGADDESPTVDALLEALRSRSALIEVVPRDSWPRVARAVGERVASGAADFGVLLCWTGTGTSIMANKVPGVRAALCWDPWIAEGARRWNDANILVMSLKQISPEDAVKILDAWLSVEGPDTDEIDNIEEVARYESERVRRWSRARSGTAPGGGSLGG
jgi:ribose 5-phosphate isomerase B